jgi:hypothetical protein
MPRVRHVPRILLNALTALSLILCAATVALWVRSYWIADVIERRERQIQVDGERGWTFLRLVSQRGKLRGTTVRHFDEVTYPANGPTGPIWSWSHDVRRRVGLYTEHGVYDQTPWNRAGIIFVKPVGYLGTQVLSVRRPILASRGRPLHCTGGRRNQDCSSISEGAHRPLPRLKL